MSTSTFEQLVQEIKDYESDTFSSEGSELTWEEAKELAEKAIRYFILNIMDGVKLSDWLEDIRGEE